MAKHVVKISGSEPITVDELLNQIRQKFVAEAKTWVISDFDITITSAEDEQSIGKIMDQFICSRWRDRVSFMDPKYQFNALVNDEQKKSFLKAYRQLYMDVTGDNDVTTEALWNYRNFNRFSLSIGSSMIMTYAYNLKITGFAKVPVPESSDRDEVKKALCEYLDTRISHNDGKSLTSADYLNSFVYVVFNFLKAIDPDNAHQYASKLNPRYNPDIVGWKNIIARETDILKGYEDMNKWFSEVGLDYEIIVSANRYKELKEAGTDKKLIFMLIG